MKCQVLAGENSDIQTARIVRRQQGTPTQQYLESCEEAQRSGRRTGPANDYSNFCQQVLAQLRADS